MDKLVSPCSQVMDMTKVNKFMKQITFKMECTSTLSNLLAKNDYAISFDLKEAYNHVPVHASMPPLLGLAWRLSVTNA
jgi:hypothetical protein